MDIRLIAEVYFGINLFIAGFALGDRFYDGKISPLWCIFIGVPNYVLLAIWAAALIAGKFIRKWDDKHYLIIFRIELLFGKWRNWDKNRLAEFNKKYERSKDVFTGRNKKNWEYAVKRINEINNYNPDFEQEAQ